MRVRLLLAGVALLLSTLTAQAVPAKPGVKKTVRQADGTLIELTLRGDEHFSFYTSEDGSAYRLLPGDRLLPMTPQEVTDTWTARRDANLGGNARRSAARSWSPRRAGKPNNATTGKHRGLIILMQFQDVKFASTDPKATFSRYFNEEGYNEGGNAGSVRDYFLKQSYGQLDIDFDIAGPYTANAKIAHYGEDNGDRIDVRAHEMVMEAIEAASKDVNFTPYDWDDDGEVDQVFIICAGYDEAEGAESWYIWPHESFGIDRTYNGKLVNTYGVATELTGNARSNPQKVLAGIGTACHEFSHCLGLPDFYDTAYNGNFGMGDWDVMNSGSYNNNSRTPSAYTSYERWFSGWLEPVELKEMTRVSGMKPIATTPECYVLYNEANHNEYYLLENRQLVDFDAKLPGHGLLVVHVDYDPGAWSSNTVNTSSSIQRMTIIPADGKLSSGNQSGDPYPGKSGNNELTNYSSPAATLNKANVDGQKLMSKPLDNITESSDGLISFVACRPELGIPELSEGTQVEGKAAFAVTWPAVKDAVSYELELTEIGAAADDPAEALQREYNFEQFISKTVGFSDVSSKLSSYGLSGWSGSQIYTTPNKMRLGTSTKTGNLVTPWWRVPESTEITIVVGAKVYKEGTPVKCRLRLGFGNQGGSINYDEDSNFVVNDNDVFVFHYTVRMDLFRVELYPESQMYMDYFAIYDGTWTAEQLGYGAEEPTTRSLAPRKATTVTVHKTTDTNYTFDNLNAKKRYVYKARAWGEENTRSLWSGEKTFVFSGYSVTPGDANGDGSVNAADIVEVVNYIMGSASAKFDFAAADVNGDGSVNAADIVVIVNMIMSGN